MRPHSAGRSHHKFNTNTRDTTIMNDEGMADRRYRNRGRPGFAPRAAAMRVAVIGALAWGLGACASGPSSSMFVDPAMYELYSCKQLGVARRVTNDRVTELERLMAKAETGAAGSLVSRTSVIAAKPTAPIGSAHHDPKRCSTPPPAEFRPDVRDYRYSKSLPCGHVKVQ